MSKNKGVGKYLVSIAYFKMQYLAMVSDDTEIKLLEDPVHGVACNVKGSKQRLYSVLFYEKDLLRRYILTIVRQLI